MSPLVSLVEDQTNYYQALGIKVESIGEDKVANLKIETESVVLFTPLPNLSLEMVGGEI